MGFYQKLTESTEQLCPFVLCYAVIQTTVSFTNEPDHFHKNGLIVQLADYISSTFHEYLGAYYPKYFEYASGGFLYRLNETKPRSYAYLQLFVISYLSYMCLIAHSVVQHILCWFCFSLSCVPLCCQFLWVVHF